MPCNYSLYFTSQKNQKKSKNQKKIPSPRLEMSPGLPLQAAPGCSSPLSKDGSAQNVLDIVQRWVDIQVK